MRWVWLSLALFLLPPVAAEKIVWYYWVDQPPEFLPDTVYFLPTTRQMFCSALQNPAPGPGPLRVDLSRLADGCFPPPYVVWGEDANGQQVYEILLKIKFWGDKRHRDKKTGLDHLLKVIEDDYDYRVVAQGKLTVGAQYHPPLKTPSGLPASASSGWFQWRASQALPLLSPQVGNIRDYKKKDPESATCRDLYGKDRCWSAELVWSLPVRLLLHGGEAGRSSLTVTPDIFLPKRSFETLRFSAENGRLAPEDAELQPFPVH